MCNPDRRKQYTDRMCPSVFPVSTHVFWWQFLKYILGQLYRLDLSVSARMDSIHSEWNSSLAQNIAVYQILYSRIYR